MSTVLSTLPPPSSPPAAAGPPPSQRKVSPRFRPDIEGLRGFGFLLLVLTHLGVWPHGGFVGVDLFFPISGFLITGLIIAEIERTGRLDLVAFYRRRARRILPPALVVLAAVWGFAQIEFAGRQLDITRRDLLWALGFGANINFARRGVDYWSSFEPPSMVQHFWSLAVEEQFYLVWPLLAIVAFFVAKRSWRGPVFGVAVVAAVVFAGSLGVSTYETIVDPKFAWFSTVGRAWELAAGALTALLVRQGWRPPATVAMLLSLQGLALIGLSDLVLDTKDPFPGLLAVPTIFGTCLILWSGTSARGVPANVILMNPVVRYIGRMSYSLYLWHWVSIRVVETLVPYKTPMIWAAILLANAGVGCASYHFVELRFQRGKETRRLRPLPMGITGMWLAGAACAAFVIGTGVKMVSPVDGGQVAVAAARAAQVVPPWFDSSARSAKSDQSVAAVARSAMPETDALRARIADALAATAWPALDPAPDVVFAGDEPDDFSTCGDVDEPVPTERCMVGDPSAPRRAYVVGDSTARGYMSMFREFPEVANSQWQIWFIGMAGCPFVDEKVDNPLKSVADACPRRRQQALDVIRRDRPDLVIWGGVAPMINLTDPHGNEVTADRFRVILNRYIAKFRSSTTALVILPSPPWGVDIASCYSRLSVPRNCISHEGEERSGYTDAMRSVAARNDGTYIESLPWFCIRQECPAFVGTHLEKRDLVHATVAYLEAIAPAAHEAFVSAGVF